MSFHTDFRSHLAGLDGGQQLVAAYDIYKQAEAMFAYRLNGCLKGGHSPPEEFLAHSQNLKKIIRARNSAPMTVFRMTSDTEFVGPILQVARGEPFKYPAFLSTSGHDNNLQNFVPNSGQPLLLEIRCPKGTPMALLEADGGLEDEFLLGAGTYFRVLETTEITDPDQILDLTGEEPGSKHMFRLLLEVVGFPAYTKDLPSFDFDPAEEEE